MTEINAATIDYSDTIERQQKYVESQKAKGQGRGSCLPMPFSGHADLATNPAWSIAEQVDNGFQAGADTSRSDSGSCPPTDTDQARLSGGLRQRQRHDS